MKIHRSLIKSRFGEGWAFHPSIYNDQLFLFHGGDADSHKAAREILQQYDIFIQPPDIKKHSIKNNYGRYYLFLVKVSDWKG